ncbi:hypothetical protein LCGC14_3163210, partial [marine sediment metagenome]
PLAGDPRFPTTKPRGGETTVGGIRDYLAQYWPVSAMVRGHDNFSEHIGQMDDVVLTWGVAASEAMDACLIRDVPYILMVRWWRNVAPLPPDDLMKRDLDQSFIEDHKKLFTSAGAVITNNLYAVEVLKRWYGIEAMVSYVAIFGAPKPGGDPKGPIIFVTDNKGVRGPETIRGIARLIPEREFVVINAFEEYSEPNISATPYQRDMDSIYRQASILINPIYDHDGCGTGRVMMEAMRYGVPVVGTDRAGLMETGGVSVLRNATPEDWAATILKILSDYTGFQTEARDSFARHNAKAELDVYVNQINRLMK